MNSLESIIKAKVDLVDFVSQDTELRRIGNTYRGKCPIHGGDNPNSFAVFDNGHFYCFACGSSGTVINYVAERDKISYEAAVEKLADKLNIDVNTHQDYIHRRDMIAECRAKARNSYHHLMNNEQLLKYLMDTRKLTKETIQMFRLGADKDSGGAVVIPIYNANDQPVAMARRYFNGSIKYKNDKNSEIYDKGSTLFGLNVVKHMVKGAVYIAEGYFDAMTGCQLGLPTCAYCGAEITKGQIQLLNYTFPPETKIILVPDEDEPGLRHLARVRDRFASMTRFEVRVLKLPKKDLNECLQENVSIPTDTVHIDKFVLEYKLSKCETKEEEYNVANDFLNTVRNVMIRADLIDYLADKWGQDKKELKEAFNVNVDTTDSLLSEVHDLYDCVPVLESLYSNGTYKTGIKGIDDCIGGVMKTNVVVLGAYSSAGKTSFALDYILNSIRENKLNVVFFSQEMSRGQVLEWILAKMIPCKFTEVRDHFKNAEEVSGILSMINEHLRIIDKNGITIDDIDNIVATINAKQIFPKGKVDMVVVDYLQYMRGTEEYETVAKYSKGMKRIAKEKDLIFVMLSQLNRQANQFEEPTINLLKGSGDIEASADYIILFWRPAQKPGISIESEQKWHNVTRFNIAKIRGYCMGSPRFMMRFNPETSRLEEMPNALD